MTDALAEKRAAGAAAADEVRDGMLVGLGTGTTATCAVEAIATRVRDGLRIEAVATSERTAALARSLGIAVRDFAGVARVDLAIDGVDEIDAAFRAIKGAGGAMLREKIVASAATRMIAVADATKRVTALGRAPIPVEIVPFAHAFAVRRVTDLGAVATLRAGADGRAWRSDQSNFVLDCRFPAIPDPAGLAAALAGVPGIVGHGLFLDEIDALYVGSEPLVERPVRR